MLIVTHKLCLTILFVDASYWDEKEISLDYYQRPYQYFLRLFKQLPLDDYSFSTDLKVQPKDILELILRYVCIFTTTILYLLDRGIYVAT